MLTEIRQDSGSDLVSLKQLDLSRQSDIRRFASEMAQEHPRLHCLVNNAGIVLHSETGFGKDSITREDTEDGLELCMASNFFGQTLLTELLLPSLKEAAKECDRVR